jgi:hypothetical protein
MDELIYLIIRLIVGLFDGNKDKAPQGPGFPNLPPRPPAQPPALPPGAQRTLTPDQVKEIRQRLTPPQPGQRPPPGQRQKPPKLPPLPVAKAAAPVRAAPKVTPPAAPVPVPPAARPTGAVDAAALRRWLKPQVLHNQFILSEIFQPPLALRERRGLRTGQ